MVSDLGINTYIPRSIEEDIKKWLFKGKIIIIYGARQTGKSTLVKRILDQFPNESKYFNGDEIDTKDLFEKYGDHATLKDVVGNYRLVVIDEAQKIKDIGLKLKILVDNFPEQQIIVTGSSSFELANRAAESLTGRNISLYLYPLSLKELSRIWDRRELNLRLESLLIYGTYPAVIKAPSFEEKEAVIRQIVSDYLYKDILALANIRKSELLRKLTEALSWQVSDEVSYSELARLLETTKETMMSYLEILEQGLVLYRLTTYGRNLRQELNRSQKVYFHDNGIRNVLINSFNGILLRSDRGAVWENFIMGEFKKRQYNILNTHPLHFWRTYDQQEIDLVEVVNGRLLATEIKWQKLKKSPPKAWTESYKDYSWNSINKDNYLDYLLEKK